MLVEIGFCKQAKLGLPAALEVEEIATVRLLTARQLGSWSDERRKGFLCLAGASVDRAALQSLYHRSCYARPLALGGQQRCCPGSPIRAWRRSASGAKPGTALSPWKGCDAAGQRVGLQSAHAEYAAERVPVKWRFPDLPLLKESLIFSPPPRLLTPRAPSGMALNAFELARFTD